MVPEAPVAAMPPSVASAPGSTEKKKPVPASAALSRLRVTPAWTRRREVLGADGEHLVHLREVDADAAFDRQHMAFQRRSDAEGDDRDALPGTAADDEGRFFRALHEHNGVGRLRAVARLVGAVLMQHGASGGESIPESLPQLGDQCVGG